MSIDQPAAGQAKSLGYTEDQLRPILNAIRAVRAGDISVTLPASQDGILGEIGREFNSLMALHDTMAGEFTRIARDLGTDGLFGGFPEVPDAEGTWKDLTLNIGYMARNLTDQVRDIALTTTSVANGDFSRKITVGCNGEIAELKATINLMLDQLAAFAAEVTQVARELGTEGKFGGQIEVKGASGAWEELITGFNDMSANLTTQVRSISMVASAAALGDTSMTIVADAHGETRALKDAVNAMVEQLRSATSDKA